MRASDADRDRIADILGDALAEGRLDATEHAERVEAAYRAKTIDELQGLIRDLPAGQPARAVASHGLHVTRGSSVVAVLSGATRHGSWRVGPRITAVAMCGGVELDLTEAIFESPYVVINATAICGGVEIRVPENVSLRNGGSGLMGGFTVEEAESASPGAPVVMVQGVALWGGVRAQPVPGKRVRNLRR